VDGEKMELEEEKRRERVCVCGSKAAAVASGGVGR
jgi:hypothetical protein